MCRHYLTDFTCRRGGHRSITQQAAVHCTPITIQFFSVGKLFTFRSFVKKPQAPTNLSLQKTNPSNKSIYNLSNETTHTYGTTLLCVQRKAKIITTTTEAPATGGQNTNPVSTPGSFP